MSVSGLRTFEIDAEIRYQTVSAEFNPDDYKKELNSLGWFKNETRARLSEIAQGEDRYDAVRVAERVSTRYGDIDFSALGFRAYEAAEIAVDALNGVSAE